MNSINALLELPLDETYSTILQNICQAISSTNSIKLKNAIMSLDNIVLKKTAIICYKIIQKNEENAPCSFFFFIVKKKKKTPRLR